MLGFHHLSFGNIAIGALEVEGLFGNRPFVVELLVALQVGFALLEGGLGLLQAGLGLGDFLGSISRLQLFQVRLGFGELSDRFGNILGTIPGNQTL